MFTSGKEDLGTRVAQHSLGPAGSGESRREWGGKEGDGQRGLDLPRKPGLLQLLLLDWLKHDWATAAVGGEAGGREDTSRLFH